MFYYIKHQKLRNFGILCIDIVVNVFLLGSSFLSMEMADLVMKQDLRKIIICSVALIGLYLVLNLLFWLQDVLIAKTIALMNGELRISLNQKIMAKNAEELSASGSGEYLSWYTNDLKEAETQGFMNFYDGINCIVRLVLSVAALVFIKWELLLCTLFTTGMVFVLSKHFQKGIEEESEKVSKMWEVFTVIVKEQIGGIRVLKYFGHQEEYAKKIHEGAASLEEQKCSYVKTQGKAALRTSALNSVATLINNLILFGMCALRIIPPQVFFGGGNIIGQVKGSILELAQLRLAIAGSKPYFEKIGRGEEKEQTGEELGEIQEAIRVKDLSFSYPGHQIFQNLNLEFQKGGKYAIVGKSGCGKSTLLKLLMGQLTGYEGQIFYDGKEASAYNPESFYKQMAYIEQSVFLFHTTIRDNITLGQEFSEEELEEALQKSALFEDIGKFPKGLDTDTGENGNNLSGGQKQRIAVARALIHKRKILIVDEGTSALDKENAKIIENALLGCDDITLLLVSHHLEEKDMAGYTKVYELGGAQS